MQLLRKQSCSSSLRNWRRLFQCVHCGAIQKSIFPELSLLSELLRLYVSVEANDSRADGLTWRKATLIWLGFADRVVVGETEECPRTTSEDEQSAGVR